MKKKIKLQKHKKPEKNLFSKDTLVKDYFKT